MVAAFALLAGCVASGAGAAVSALLQPTPAARTASAPRIASNEGGFMTTDERIRARAAVGSAEAARDLVRVRRERWPVAGRLAVRAART